MTTYKLTGSLPINRLLVSDPSMLVREVMDTDMVRIAAMTGESEVAKLFEKFDLVSAPVVGTDGHLLGRITIDDVVDVIRENAEHQVMSMAGLDDDEDTFAPAWRTSRRRAVWLGVNLITAFMAAAVIGQYLAAAIVLVLSLFL